MGPSGKRVVNEERAAAPIHHLAPLGTKGTGGRNDTAALRVSNFAQSDRVDGFRIRTDRWQDDFECGALSQAAFYLNIAAVIFYKTIADRQPQADAAPAFGFGREKIGRASCRERV